MFETDAQIKFQALNMWANHIETGTCTMSANDYRDCGHPENIKQLDLFV